MRELLHCPAPAKLNLFLHVTGRRPDGYHLLQTVFQMIDRCDWLDFRLRADSAIVRSTEVPGVPQEQDLIIRAARALQAAYQARHGRLPPGVDIAIDKRLPMGGGLGGGSSDAATTLLALNALWQGGFTRAELCALALPLGADVPFFVFGETAFAEGVGEALQPVAAAGGPYVVLEPGVAVPTGPIFSSEHLTRDTKPVTIADFLDHLAQRKLFGKNDLQAVATRLYPPVQQALDWLGQFGEARMSGSGACVFLAARDAAQADAIVQAAPPAWRAWSAQALATHPMRTRLQSGEGVV
ncbi:4-(cytidine 5'-diphospho)-2-C-methyl-D-erythritol kinase [Massilia sp. TS11]|uniref:4-(cytidine 5'-diphospho)-2-C-methyl-D-erythritol kinase n=1 Tax=Massilia sp. TS11 TaxID=2908003 RepID=UPI001EDAA3B0|nr:4-(cytidine 5'-diphospho)-2-C-methyl-D-erythritol kinase [Massilia sp. TS11]MCG2584922.1 4-(cytidine 5'-diphospho)-2-C-methyl-D-erythritol kinase [Massilia sp. TS11]